jgi:transcriptional regulator with XRE-family HTH domain
MPERWDAAGFTDLIGKIRESAGLKDSHLAKLAGVDPSTISRWRRGQTRPDADAVRKLMDGLARRHPETAQLTAGLYDAAGYGVVNLEPLPDLVADNWDDETVRVIWAADVPQDARIGMIVTLLDARKNDQPA